MNYCTAKQTAERWGITANRITILCKSGRIPGVTQIGTNWMIPETAEKPADGRTRNAKKGIVPDFFRFPLYVNFPEKSFMPPLTPEEKKLRRAQLDFFSCEFSGAVGIFDDLIENAENLYIKICALAFRCIIATHYENGVNFQVFFARFNLLLARDFPHKREMQLFIPWIYSYSAEYRNVSESLQFNPEYSYSSGCLPMTGMLSFAHLLNTDPRNMPESVLDIYETECRQIEDNGCYYEAQELHFLLLVYYHLRINKPLVLYHLRKGLRIAFEHNLILVAACYASFYPAEYREALSDFPAVFAEKIFRSGSAVKKSAAVFMAANNDLNIYRLSGSDYQLIYYVLKGYTNLQISALLGKSVKTVANRFNKIYEKLEIRGRKELTKTMLLTGGNNPCER